MNGQADRCDRTAYVSGLQPTISDIELFEVFNRVAHVEKVIVRNGAVRHALVVFKTVQGLYQVLINFQGTTLHGRQLHIRPLRESSHANSEAITTMFEKAKGATGVGVQKRHSSAIENPFGSTTPTEAQNPPPQYSSTSYKNYNNPRGYRTGSASSGGFVGNNGRRRGGYNKPFHNDSYSSGMASLFDPNIQQYNGFGGNAGSGHQNYQQNDPQMQFEDYAEGAKRFDNLANLIRSSTPTDPFANYQKLSENATSSAISFAQRQRAGSARQAPPTWKMELQIKNEQQEAAAQLLNSNEDNLLQPPTAALGPHSMTPQEFLAQIAMQTAATAAAAEKARNEGQKRQKTRPNLSVINPSLFYEQYPRTSSPVVPFAPHSTPNDKNPSPHDPAVLAYSRLRAPQSAFDGLSPIDTNNCSFITKHLGCNLSDNLNSDNTQNHQEKPRDLTNDELSDMIVSTGNLRMNPVITADSDTSQNPDEPAPWSPLKRLRAESGCHITAQQMASPQFSPIKPKESAVVEDTMDSEEDDVFGSGSEQKPSNVQDSETEKIPENAQKINSNFEDINNSRLPSNSHSAAPSSDQKSFVFPPEYPMCRHSSVPSIAHLVGDLSDFCPLSPQFVTEKLQNGETELPCQEGEEVDKTSDDKTVDIQQKSSEEVLKALEI